MVARTLDDALGPPRPNSLDEQLLAMAYLCRRFDGEVANELLEILGLP
jgi:hypothetical protein